MAQVLIRDLDDEVVKALKKRAEQNHRSLQRELKAIITEAARPRRIDPKLLARIDALRNSLKGRIHGDSVDLIRKERER